MLNRNLCKRLKGVECTNEELSCFIDRHEDFYGLADDFFKEYYSLDSILKCINLYKAGEITERYLTSWANAYAWLLLGNDKSDTDEVVTFKALVEYDIADWLDGLSCFDGNEENLIEDFAHAFEALDTIYRNLDEWTPHVGYFDNVLSVVAVNDGKRPAFDRKQLPTDADDCGNAEARCQDRGVRACRARCRHKSDHTGGVEQNRLARGKIVGAKDRPLLRGRRSALARKRVDQALRDVADIRRARLQILVVHRGKGRLKALARRTDRALGIRTLREDLALNGVQIIPIVEHHAMHRKDLRLLPAERSKCPLKNGIELSGGALQRPSKAAKLTLRIRRRFSVTCVPTGHKKRDPADRASR